MLYIQQNLPLFTIDKNVCSKAVIDISIPSLSYWKNKLSVSNQNQIFLNKNSKKSRQNERNRDKEKQLARELAITEKKKVY